MQTTPFQNNQKKKTFHQGQKYKSEVRWHQIKKR